jgi:hypothetical protein
LKHNVNCLIVKNGDWVGTVTGALNMSFDKIVAMRQSVRALRDQALTIRRSAERLARKCGLKDHEMEQVHE